MRPMDDNYNQEPISLEAERAERDKANRSADATRRGDPPSARPPRRAISQAIRDAWR